MDPLTAKMLMGLGQSAIGQKQVGPAAPIHQPGYMNFNAGGLLDPDNQDQPFINQLMQTQAPSSIEELLSMQPQDPQELQPQVTANETAGLPSLEGMAQQQQQAVGDPGIGTQEQGGFGQKLGGFFGNMDQNMQSPSKVIGMGLLGRINPALGYGGLLASGLFGKNKLF